jgi:hypothetical protein
MMYQDVIWRIQGLPKPEVKISNPKNFAPGSAKLGMKSYFVYLSRKANPFVYEVENRNTANLQGDHQNQREKSETPKILPQEF